MDWDDIEQVRIHARAAEVCILDLRAQLLTIAGIVERLRQGRRHHLNHATMALEEIADVLGPPMCEMAPDREKPPHA